MAQMAGGKRRGAKMLGLLGIFALAAAVASFGSGLWVVGNRERWTYSLDDLKRLRFDALLYVALTFTTIWSLAHIGLLAEYPASPRVASIAPAHFAAWMLLHFTISGFLIGLHAYVGASLRRPATAARLRGFLLGS